MDFFFTLHLFSFVFLNPRFDAALDKPVLAVIRQSSGSGDQAVQYRYSADGREMHYDLAPEGGAYRVKVLPREDGLMGSLEILQLREGARPEGDLVRFQFAYGEDRRLDTIRISTNDSLERVQYYAYDPSGRLDAVTTNHSRKDSNQTTTLSITHDSLGRRMTMGDTAGSGRELRFEFDENGRLKERLSRERPDGSFRTDMKLYYNDVGQWTRWEKYSGDSLQAVYTMEYLPREKALSLQGSGNGVLAKRPKANLSPHLRLAWNGRDLLGRRL